ncbi:MAG: hypothetical protein ACOC1N_06445, partial [Bacillota bacterium]
GRRPKIQKLRKPAGRYVKFKIRGGYYECKSNFWLYIFRKFNNNVRIIIICFFRKMLGDEILLKVQIKKSKYYKYTSYIYYIVFLISFPAFLYTIIQNNSMYESSQHLFFSTMSIFFIYYYRAKLNIYNNGISYMDSFIRWEKINGYQIEDDIIKLDVNGKKKEFGTLYTEKEKRKIINIFNQKLK